MIYEWLCRELLEHFSDQSLLGSRKKKVETQFKILSKNDRFNEHNDQLAHNN